MPKAREIAKGVRGKFLKSRVPDRNAISSILGRLEGDFM